MKKLFLFILSVFSLTVFAQQAAPKWYDARSRSFYYPTDQYFVGYAEGEQQRYESVENAISRIKSDARVEALSTIRVHIQSTTKINILSKTLETMEDYYNKTTEGLAIHTVTSVEMEIPGLQVEAWRNPETGAIAAFAYVQKATLIRQLERRVTVALTKIETSLDQLDQMIANGQKMQARDAAEKVFPLFKELDEAQSLLLHADENADEESLQLAETKELYNHLSQLVVQLKNGLNIYISCYAYMFGQQYPALKSEIEGALSPLGCTFVSRADKSDWAIEIIGSAREHYSSENFYCVYMDIKITITKTATGQRIYENHLPQGQATKGTDTNSFEGAARDGYQKVTPILVDIIKEHIQQ